MDLAALLPVLEPFAILAMLTMARAGGLLLALPAGASTAVPGQVRAIVLVALSLSMIGIAAPPAIAYGDIVSLVVAIVLVPAAAAVGSAPFHLVHQGVHRRNKLAHLGVVLELERKRRRGDNHHGDLGGPDGLRNRIENIE